MKILKFTFVLLTAAFVFAALACGSPAGNTAPPNANIESASNSTDNAQPTAGSGEVEATAPETVVGELYKTHDAKKSPFFQTKDRALVDKFFVKATADLIWRDAKESAANNTVGLGFDPLYDGQDFEIKDFKLEAGTTKDDISTVKANFSNFGEKQTVTFLLRKISDSWKIEDIRYRESGTLLALLKDQFNSPKEDVIESPASFEGKYRVGDTTCTVLPIRMAFEIRWAKGSGSEIFHFTEGTTFEASADGGVNQFVFDDDRYDTGTFRRADGKTFAVRRAK